MLSWEVGQHTNSLFIRTQEVLFNSAYKNSAGTISSGFYPPIILASTPLGLAGKIFAACFCRWRLLLPTAKFPLWDISLNEQNPKTLGINFKFPKWSERQINYRKYMYLKLEKPWAITPSTFSFFSSFLNVRCISFICDALVLKACPMAHQHHLGTC